MSQVCVRKKEGQIIFLVEWKGTCTSSTLAGCQLIFLSVVCELIFISVACEKKKEVGLFSWYLYLLNSSWLPTNLYFLTHTWLIREERTMTSRWKRTCTSSTLGKQLRCSLVSNFWWVRCLREKRNGLFLSCTSKVKIFLTVKLLLKQQCHKNSQYIDSKNLWSILQAFLNKWWELVCITNCKILKGCVE